MQVKKDASDGGSEREMRGERERWEEEEEEGGSAIWGVLLSWKNAQKLSHSSDT